jgi:ribosomal protein L37AE/L43A
MRHWSHFFLVRAQTMSDFGSDHGGGGEELLDDNVWSQLSLAQASQQPNTPHISASQTRILRMVCPVCASTDWHRTGSGEVYCDDCGCVQLVTERPERTHPGSMRSIMTEILHQTLV